MTAGKKNKKVGVQDIADILHVSVSTVSRALNDHPRISREMKEKVRQTASRIGYYPGIPELMHPEKTEAVAVLVPALKNALYQEIVSGITDYFNRFDYQTFVIDTRGDDERTSSFFKTFRKYGISGIVHFISNRHLQNEFYSVLQRENFPVVSVFEPDVPENISMVLPDMFQGVSKILESLKSFQIKRIALLLENDDKPEDFQLLSAFNLALDLSGLDKRQSHVHYFSHESPDFAKKVIGLMQSKNRPEALLVKGTLSAATVLRILEKEGFSVPKDFLLIAIGVEEFPDLTYNLSLLKIPGYQMGYQAAEILLEQINNPSFEKKDVVLPVNFLLKGSAMRIK
ncbi:LacI family transcriptional regulator [Candidatus Sulfidibacterium hydrothermale]|uniref:LacI family DNA-binding transcriptional regulator n=1 Tax=Candidatus Sulfidibacterium hydrothermale TaxID=2875962 RepID=UPI001F0AF3BA|nr:LacI family DNA-binding transcriptional regulator [Candidatus Sulfidibacterium hydrothermale]UBM62520.1 LacI family transcriptional regulator [Candidatus Sulfidibacterium hydrothermale]